MSCTLRILGLAALGAMVHGNRVFEDVRSLQMAQFNESALTTLAQFNGTNGSNSTWHNSMEPYWTPPYGPTMESMAQFNESALTALAQRTTPSTVCDEAVLPTGEAMGAADKVLCKTLHPSLLKMLFTEECDPNMQTFIDEEVARIKESLKDKGKGALVSEALGTAGLSSITDVLASTDAAADSLPTWGDVPDPKFQYLGEETMAKVTTKTRTIQVGLLALGVAAEVFLFPLCWFQCALSAASTAATVGAPEFIASAGFEASKFFPIRVYTRLYKQMCTVDFERFTDYMREFARKQDEDLPDISAQIDNWDNDDAVEFSPEEWAQIKAAHKK